MTRSEKEINLNEALELCRWCFKEALLTPKAPFGIPSLKVFNLDSFDQHDSCFNQKGGIYSFIFDGHRPAYEFEAGAWERFLENQREHIEDADFWEAFDTGALDGGAIFRKAVKFEPLPFKEDTCLALFEVAFDFFEYQSKLFWHAWGEDEVAENRIFSWAEENGVRVI